jgi:hypothetical protein
MEALSTEIKDLESWYNTFSRSHDKVYYSTTAPLSDIVSLWFNQVENTCVLSNMLPTLASDSLNMQFLQFRIMQNAAGVLPAMHIYRQQQGIIMRAINREICRSLVILVDWVLDIEPQLIAQLMHIHRFYGYEGLHKDAPEFATLVQHIVEYVHLEILSLAKSRPATKPLKYDATPSHLQFGECAGEIAKVPADMYGLWKSGSMKGPLRLKKIYLRVNTSQVDILKFYDICSDILSDLWRSHIIIPQLRPLDQDLSKGKYSKDSDELILQRCITRGVILSSIAEVCGSDGIFASSRIDTVLISPAMMFKNNLNSDRRFAPAVQKRRKEILDPFINYMQTLIDHSTTDIKSAIHNLGHFVTKRLTELHVGGPILEDQENIEDIPNNSKKVTKNARHPSNVKITPSNLLEPGLISPRFEILGVIIREALNQIRGLQPGDNILKSVLNGQHPTQNASKSHNPDQTNPIREFSSGADLFRQHLPPQKLTTRIGLSNLLSWMSTGQGNTTKTFLDSSGFFAESLEEMVQKFQDASNRNAQLLASQGFNTQEGNLTKVRGYITYDDMEIWGQPNNLLSATPTVQEKVAGLPSRSPVKKKLTFQEKFSPFWTEVVQNAWVQFLGDMLDQDPLTWEGPRKGWLDFLSLLKGLQLNAFKNGLTVFQSANNISFSKIVNPPPKNHIADWIFENKKLGANAGLRKLGFCLSSLETIYAAFGCVHDHINNNISDADRRLLGFGTMNVEHILCKVGRWHNRLTQAKEGEYLAKSAAQAIEDKPMFTKDENATDAKALPFPHVMSVEAMQEAVAEMLVSFQI